MVFTFQRVLRRVRLETKSKYIDVADGSTGPIESDGSIGCTHMINTSCKIKYLNREKAKGGGVVKIEVLVANQIIKPIV